MSPSRLWPSLALAAGLTATSASVHAQDDDEEMHFEPDEIGPYVEGLAKRIASFPPSAVRLAKQSINQSEKPWLDGLFEEAYLFEQLLRTDAARTNMQRFLEIGGQTREGELEVAVLSARANRED